MRIASIQRFFDGLLNWPSTSDSASGESVRNAETVADGFQAPLESVNLKDQVVSAIAGLFAFCSPSTVPRFVMSVVVDSVDTVTRRRKAHIGNEVVKTLSPSLAHGYPSRSVRWVACGVGIVASLLHGAPNLVNRMLGESVPSHCTGRQGLLLATAAFGAPSLEREGRYSSLVSALAFADPKRSSSLDAADNRQKAEDMSDEIFLHTDIVPQFGANIKG